MALVAAVPPTHLKQPPRTGDAWSETPLPSGSSQEEAIKGTRATENEANPWYGISLKEKWNSHAHSIHTSRSIGSGYYSLFDFFSEFALFCKNHFENTTSLTQGIT